MTHDRAAAVRFFEESIEYARGAGDQSLVCSASLLLAQAYSESREFNKSLAAADQAITAARQSGDRRQEAWALDSAGNALYRIGKFTAALGDFQAAASLMKETNDRYGEAVTLKDAGILCKYLRRYEEGFDYLNAALQIFRDQHDNSETLSTLHNIGMGYATLGANRLALEAYEEALKVARENNDRSGACHVLIRIGYLVRDPEMALSYLSEALALAQELKLYDLQVEVLNGMSSALEQSDQLDRAILAQERALAIDRRWNSREAVELNGLGHLYLKRDPASAARYFRAALDSARKESDSPFLASTYYGLGEAHHRLGDLDVAVEYYQHAVDSVDFVRAKLTSTEYKASFSGQNQHIYNGLIEALLERHSRYPGREDDRKAFAALERAKARSLLEAITEARVGMGREVEQDAVRELRLTSPIPDLQQQLLKTEPGSEARQSMRRQLDLAEQEFERLRAEIKLKNPRSPEFSFPKPVSIDEAQKLLDNRTAILAFLVAEDRTTVFIITSTLFQIESLPIPAATVRALVQNYVDLINQGDTQGWQTVSGRLYIDLIAPVREHLPPEVDSLVIVPDDALHCLAFETLISGAGSANAPQDEHQKIRYLLEDFTMSYAPSVTVFARLAVVTGQRTTEHASVAVFADPAFAVGRARDVSQWPASLGRSLYEDEGLQISRLPFSRSEAGAIQQYAGPGSRVYTGEEASEGRIKTDNIGRFQVIHFATHGLISQRMPARSALVLAPGKDEDGFLQIREICRLKLESDLVVLSACETARGKVLAQEGVRGLAQAFLYAGARSVVASLWDVDDERTSLFMESFYRNLAAKKSKVSALRAAKLELLSRSATASPRFWASFILIGEPNGRVSLVNRGWTGIWLPRAAVICLALVALLFVVRRIKRREVERVQP